MTEEKMTKIENVIEKFRMKKGDFANTHYSFGCIVAIVERPDREKC